MPVRATYIKGVGEEARPSPEDFEVSPRTFDLFVRRLVILVEGTESRSGARLPLQNDGTKFFENRFAGDRGLSLRFR
jgi:hypothetical protein